MPHRQQQIFYPGIGLHQLIKFQYPACLRIAGIFFRDLTVPQHIVSHNDTSRPHLIEYQPVIRCILPFIGIDEYQIEAFIQPGYYLTGISDMKNDLSGQSATFDIITRKIFNLVIDVDGMEHAFLSHAHRHRDGCITGKCPDFQHPLDPVHPAQHLQELPLQISRQHPGS